MISCFDVFAVAVVVAAAAAVVVAVAGDGGDDGGDGDSGDVMEEVAVVYDLKNAVSMLSWDLLKRDCRYCY